MAFTENTVRPSAKKRNVGVGEMASAWVWRGGAMTRAIVGGRSPQQVKETVRGAAVKLSVDELQAIEEGLKKRLAAIGQ